MRLCSWLPTTSLLVALLGSNFGCASTPGRPATLDSIQAAIPEFIPASHAAALALWLREHPAVRLATPKDFHPIPHAPGETPKSSDRAHYYRHGDFNGDSLEDFVVGVVARRESDRQKGGVAIFNGQKGSGAVRFRAAYYWYGLRLSSAILSVREGDRLWEDYDNMVLHYIYTPSDSTYIRQRLPDDDMPGR